jgi:alkanesulfonate monooxygenase SsuD/methylene tetrahydromethanopterin reductase-like flavin-dependent oxidoreductase (luciferase family)
MRLLRSLTGVRRAWTLVGISAKVVHMEFGVHLPLIDFGEGSLTLEELQTYAATAHRLGYATLSANDHLVWRKPWMDGPAALASVLGHAGSMAVATSITLVNVRHPVVVAKWLTTLAHLSGGRVIAGLGPGSSSADYAAVGIPFEQRWARFDDAFVVVRQLVHGRGATSGTFSDVADVQLAPLPARPPEVWFGSWGSDRRLRALAAVTDGWMASGYHTTPAAFAEARSRLDAHLLACERDPADVSDLIATMWLLVTPTRREADRVLGDVLGPVLDRDVDELADQLPIGPPEHCIRLLQAYADAGAQQVLLWPVADPIDQLHQFDDLVRPHVS